MGVGGVAALIVVIRIYFVLVECKERRRKLLFVSVFLSVCLFSFDVKKNWCHFILCFFMH